MLRIVTSPCYQHPAKHLPLPSNSIVRPLMPRCAVPFNSLISAAAREPGLNLPPSVTGLVRVGKHHRCGPDQLVHRVRGRLHCPGVGSEIEHCEIRFVVLAHDRFHLAVNAGVAREISGEPVGELDDEAGGRSEVEAGAVCAQGRATLVQVEKVRNAHYR
ncbi:MAG: hypothetical protein ACXW5W_17360 [Candidatus Binatia bacterium]